MPCTTITIQEPEPLTITHIEARRNESTDDPAHGYYGVFLEIHIRGKGKPKNMRIAWAVDDTELKTSIVEGNYAYVKQLPAGNHKICAELF